MMEDWFKDNKIFLEAAKSRFKPNVLFVIIIFLVLVFLSELFYIILYQLFMSINVNTNIMTVLDYGFEVLLIPFAISILCFFAWVKNIEKRSISTLGFFRKNSFIKYLRGFLLGFVAIALQFIILYQFNLLNIEGFNFTSRKILEFSGVLIVLSGWIVQGASEEIMFRGWLMSVIGSRNSPILGIGISAVLFAFFHLSNNNISILSIINLIFFGLFSALYVIWEESLWGICAFHTAWNWAQGNIFGFSVSGMKAPGSRLMYIRIKGIEWLTGGKFGLEGGVLVTILLVSGIGILILLLLNRIQKKRVEE